MNKNIFFILLRRRPRVVPVDECEENQGVFCFGDSAAIDDEADNPAKRNAQTISRRRIFRWGHGLCPWGSIPIFTGSDKTQAEYFQRKANKLFKNTIIVIELMHGFKEDSGC